METVKKIREITYDAECVKNITIADESYLKEVDEKGKLPKHIEEITLYEYKPRCCKVCKVCIREEDITYYYDNNELNFRLYTIRVVSDSNGRFTDTYLEGKHYTDTVKSEKKLACDTASFIIKTENGIRKFNTLCDGFYGGAYVFKEYYGFSININLDADALDFMHLDFDGLVKVVRELFPKKKEQ